MRRPPQYITSGTMPLKWCCCGNKTATNAWILLYFYFSLRYFFSSLFWQLGVELCRFFGYRVRYLDSSVTFAQNELISNFKDHRHPIKVFILVPDAQRCLQFLRVCRWWDLQSLCNLTLRNIVFKIFHNLFTDSFRDWRASAHLYFRETLPL